LTLTKHLYPLILALLLVACSAPVEKKKLELKAGVYELLFDIGEVSIPARLRITENRLWCIHNWNETIMLDSIDIKDSLLSIDMPLFNTTLTAKILNDSVFVGKWTDHSRDSLYEIPFSARLMSHDIASCDPKFKEHNNKLVYDVTFSPDSEEDRSRAIGEFYNSSNTIVGTFLTESGDYRYLEGTYTGSSLELSSFDGAHLFYFCANIENNELTHGKFYSGKHWQEDWHGFINPQAQLRDPDSLTFVQDQEEEFYFYAKNTSGDSILFDSSRFNGKVSVIQIFGSWCPNCTDESRFMKELYEQYNNRGLEIIPVAFERTTEFNAGRDAVLKQFVELELKYPPYFGGQANKVIASQVFSKLSNITSYPTTIFIDKKGKIRKIHTGFYGPGTGEHYVSHTKELRAFVEQLLAE